MSPGYLTLNGREETPEGLDRKMVVSYYGRQRFASNFLPLLQAAAANPSESARVISVLAPGREGALKLDDLGLAAPGNHTLGNVEAHTVTMTSLAFEELALRHPDIGWIHAYPGIVVTGMLRGLPAPLRVLGAIATPVLKCFSVPIEDSGHGFAWLSTNEGFRKGLRLVDWKGETLDSRTNEGKRFMNPSAQWWGDEKRKSVWEHTQTVFDSVKRPAL